MAHVNAVIYVNLPGDMDGEKGHATLLLRQKGTF